MINNDSMNYDKYQEYLERHSGQILSILKERERQDKKWGSFKHHDPMKWLTILVEEVGEVSRGIQTRDAENLRDEIVQVAAIAIAWVEDIDNTAETEEGGE